LNSGSAGNYAELAFTRLEEMIVTLELRPGELLSEARLSARLGIGRTPIREALQRLEAAQLVSIIPRTGALVSDLSLEQQALLFEVSRELQRLVARRAAIHARPQEKARFLDLADEMTSAVTNGDIVSALRVQRSFERFMAQCARNQYATRALEPLLALSRRFWFVQLEGGLSHVNGNSASEDSGTLRVDLMRAIGSGDADAAAASSDRLIGHMLAVTEAAFTTLLPVFSESEAAETTRGVE